MQKIILGFTGLLASGKGTAASYFEQKYNAKSYRFSTILRALADRIYIEQSRDNLIKMSETIRATFGEDILAKAIAGDAAKSENELIIVEGIRRMPDIEHLKRLPSFILIEISADPQTRYDRLVQRNENVDDRTKTYEQFLEDHKRSTEMSIPEVISHATEHIDNNGTIEQLHQSLDLLLNRHKN